VLVLVPSPLLCSYQLPIWSVGGGPGPGIASNGGSVLLTPTTDDTAPCQYRHFAPSANHSFSSVRWLGSIGYADGVDEAEDNGEEAEEDRMATSSRCFGGAI
jgi:hypothetical protein